MYSKQFYLKTLGTSKVQALKFYKKYLKNKFSDLSIELLTSRINKVVEPLLTKIQSDPSFIEIDLSITFTLRKWTDDNNYAISLESNNRYNLDR